MRTDLEVLTGELPDRNGELLLDRQSQKHRRQAARYLEDRLQENKITIARETFANGENVVAEIRGSVKPEEVVEFGAHYDSLSRGADDNAAGVALLLELTRLFASQPPKRTLRFIFYDLEEINGDGAKHHAARVKKDPRRFLGAVVVDAIGYFPPDLTEKVVLLELGTSSLGKVLDANIALVKGLLPRELNEKDLYLHAEFGEIAGLHCDHGAYWDHHLPAVLFSRPYPRRFNNPFNHGSGDTIANLNWDYYQNAALLFLKMAKQIAHSQLLEQSLPRSYKDL